MGFSTDQYELLLLSTIVKDDDAFRKTMGLADSQMFSSAMSSDVYDILRVFYAEYNRVPTQSELLYLYKRDRTIADDSIVVGFLNLIYTQEVDTKFVTNELNRYAKLRKLENLFKTSYEKIKSGSDVDVSSTVSSMFKIQMDSIEDKHIYGVNIDESEYILEQGKTRKCVPTNISFLNDILRTGSIGEVGGLGAGQLGIILAPPNYGKTMSLLNFALYAWLKGHNVLFVTLEMPEFSILRRVMMLLSGALKMDITMDGIKVISEKVNKKFMILYRPVRSISVDYLYSVYHQADADGIKFDIMYVDYADLLLSQARYKEKRFELADIFSALKAYSQILQIPVWSATQANREGLRAEVVTMEHMSESIDKAFVSDVVLSLCEKMEPGKVSKFFLTKHREGKSDIYIDMFVNDKMWVENSERAVSVSMDNVS
jgi:replicative DNA helicase